MMKLMLLIGSALCCAIVFRGCSSSQDLGGQTVKDVVGNPRQFTDREVAVAGIAGNSFAVMGLGYFQLLGDDGSVLTILSNQSAPTQGKRVTVRGTLHQAYAIGQEQMLVLVETPKRTAAALGMERSSGGEV